MLLVNFQTMLLAKTVLPHCLPNKARKNTGKNRSQSLGEAGEREKTKWQTSNKKIKLCNVVSVLSGLFLQKEFAVQWCSKIELVPKA